MLQAANVDHFMSIHQGRQYRPGLQVFQCCGEPAVVSAALPQPVAGGVHGLRGDQDDIHGSRSIDRQAGPYGLLHRDGRRADGINSFPRNPLRPSLGRLGA